MGQTSLTDLKFWVKIQGSFSGVVAAIGTVHININFGNQHTTMSGISVSNYNM